MVRRGLKQTHWSLWIFRQSGAIYPRESSNRSRTILFGVVEAICIVELLGGDVSECWPSCCLSSPHWGHRL
jgi:uncharacterized protein (DUF1810 family)